LKRAEKHRWKQELLNGKWQHTNEEIAPSKILTAKNAIEHRNLGILSYYIKCKWENGATKAELRLRGEQE